MRTFLPRTSFELSSLEETLGVEQTLAKRRPVHTAFATTLLTIDHGITGSERLDALKGLVQAWDYFARQHGEDVVVEYSGKPWQEFTTSITSRELTSEMRNDNNRYAVANTARDTFLDLGGALYTSSLETAATQMPLSTQFELVHLQQVPIPDSL